MTDYGKLAFEGLEELKTRLSKLEQIQKENTFNELKFYSGSTESRFIFEEFFRFNVVKSCEMNLKLFFKINGSNGHSQVSIYINGFKYKSFFPSADSFEIDFQPVLEKGKCVIKAEILYFEQFNLEECDLFVSGAVEYADIFGVTSAVNLSDCSVICSQYGNASSIYLYDGTTLYKKLTQNCKFSAVSVLNGAVLVGVVDENGVFKVYTLDLTAFTLSNETVVSNGVSWISGSKAVDCFRFYAVLGCRVYQFDLLSDLTFSRTQTSHYATKVFSSPNVFGTSIFLDVNGKIKLAVDG